MRRWGKLLTRLVCPLQELETFYDTATPGSQLAPEDPGVPLATFYTLREPRCENAALNPVTLLICHIIRHIVERQADHLHQLERVGRGGDAGAQVIIERHRWPRWPTGERLGEVNGVAGCRQIGRLADAQVMGGDGSGRAVAQQRADDLARGNLALAGVGAVQNLIQQEERLAFARRCRRMRSLHHLAQTA